jgi:hypothetical protein
LRSVKVYIATVIEERAWRMRPASTCSRLDPGEKYTCRTLAAGVADVAA